MLCRASCFSDPYADEVIVISDRPAVPRLGDLHDTDGRNVQFGTDIDLRTAHQARWPLGQNCPVVRVVADSSIDGLVHRYDTAATEDGLPPGEGAFLACSFWYVDNLVLLGRHVEARALFENLLSLRNDVGLLAEGYDTRAKRQLGNFPQAFSHVALVSSAFNLNEYEPVKPARQRSTTQ